MKKRILTFTILLFTLSLTYASCSCEELSIKDAYNSSDLIFTGRLVDKEIKITEINAPKIEEKQRYTRVVFTFEVIELIKGKKRVKTVKISSRYNDIDFKRGDKYLIYSYYSEYLLTTNFYLNGEKVTPFLVTDVCTNTKKISKVEKREIKKLKRFARKEDVFTS